MNLIGGLNLDEDEDITGSKRRRIASAETVVSSSAKPIVSRGQTTPMKITLSKPVISTPSTTSAQKVFYCPTSVEKI